MPPTQNPKSTRTIWWRDRVLPAVALALMAAGLWATRPADWSLGASPPDADTQTCLSNLNRISAAFAQYAQDYDGKFPRGVDPEDRNNPNIWRYRKDKGYYNAANSAPMLHELLQPYTRQAQVWHCPADVGWSGQPLPGMSSGLTDVHPSSYAKFGTSYYYLTRYGFAGVRARELEYPDQAVALFDGAFWHNSGRSSTPAKNEDNNKSLNALFADGHVANLSAARFQQALELDIARWNGR